MRFVSYQNAGGAGVALKQGDTLRDLGNVDLVAALAAGALKDLAAKAGAVLDPASLTYRAALPRPPKILCIGLNYIDHAAESPYAKVPDYPAVFPRVATSLVGHGQPIIRPLCSEQLDYEGEMAIVIGRGGKHISRADALNHVGFYGIFNDGSLRDYQFKSTQWTMGKNFDATGGFGPELVTADEVPAGGAGLKIETRLNGQVVQAANTDDMVFKVVDLIYYLSECVTLEPGDLIVTGTPAGVGFARKPPLWMKHGDVCEVALEGFQTLSNPIHDEVR